MAEKCWKMTFTGSKWMNILTKDQNIKKFYHRNSLKPNMFENQETFEMLFEDQKHAYTPPHKKLIKATSTNVQDYSTKEVNIDSKNKEESIDSKAMSKSINKSGESSRFKPAQTNPNFHISAQIQKPVLVQKTPKNEQKQEETIVESEAQIDFLYRLWGKSETKPVINTTEKIKFTKLMKKQSAEVNRVLEIKNPDTAYKISHKRGDKVTKSYNYIIRMSESRFVLKNQIKPPAPVTQPLPAPVPESIPSRLKMQMSSETPIYYRTVSQGLIAKKEVFTQVIQFKPENVGRHHCSHNQHEIEEKRCKVLRKAQTGTFSKK